MKRSPLPVIGITADVAEARKPNHEPRLFLPQRYLRAIEQSGALPVILPPLARSAAIRTALGVLDGLVISGGNFDIHPSYYGEKPIKQMGIVKANRTEFELEIADSALQEDLPILGLCGGQWLSEGSDVGRHGSMVGGVAGDPGRPARRGRAAVPGGSDK